MKKTPPRSRSSIPPSPQRRRFLSDTAASLAGVVTAGALPWLAPSPSKAHTRQDSNGQLPGPRYIVQIILFGGVDSVYTTDPKQRSEVLKDVDVPYEPKAIVEQGGMRVGPHFAPLKPYLQQFTIVNGMRMGVADHFRGLLQYTRMKRGLNKQTPSILEILGTYRDGQPLGSVSLGDFLQEAYSPGWFGSTTPFPGQQPLLETLEQLGADERVLIAKTLRKQAISLNKTTSAEQKSAVSALQQSADLMLRLNDVPQFKQTTWSKRDDTVFHSANLQRLIWLLENDLTRCVCLQPPGQWDSHQANAERQTYNTEPFADSFSYFLAELSRRKNKFGPLDQQTLILVGSELGRHPVLNSELGKDHFPEAPMIIIGPKSSQSPKGVLIGGTGTQMESLKLSLKNGQPSSTGDYIYLEDLGTTLLHMAGLKPLVYGYSGRVLPFLLRST